jgi:predicted small metal-binding protein
MIAVYFLFIICPSTNNHFILLSSPILCIIRKGNETISLHDIGLDCGYIIEDKTEEDIVKSAEQHIWEIHAIKPEEITSE